MLYAIAIRHASHARGRWKLEADELFETFADAVDRAHELWDDRGLITWQIVTLGAGLPGPVAEKCGYAITDDAVCVRPSGHGGYHSQRDTMREMA